MNQCYSEGHSSGDNAETLVRVSSLRETKTLQDLGMGKGALINLQAYSQKAPKSQNLIRKDSLNPTYFYPTIVLLLIVKSSRKSNS